MKLNTIQKIENLNSVYVADSKGNGGAYHTYNILESDSESVPSKVYCEIKFQNGPRKEEGSQHGVLDQDLLEIVRHRLQCFQEGPFATDYNGKALEHIELALEYLNARVEDRIVRQVLGTYNK